MARLPLPPPVPELAALSPVWHDLPVGTLLWRIYFAEGKYPTSWNRLRHYGPTSARFDHHTYPKREQERAIAYLALDGLTSFAEVFQASATIDLNLNGPVLVAFRTRVPLRLLDLTGHWPTRAGASMAISAGSHHRARARSRAIYAAFPEADGLWYCSSMGANRPCVALYERGRDAIPDAASFHAALADPRLRLIVDSAARDLNYTVISRRRPL